MCRAYQAKYNEHYLVQQAFKTIIIKIQNLFRMKYKDEPTNILISWFISHIYEDNTISLIIHIEFIFIWMG